MTIPTDNNSITLTILGSGTSTGVPMSACSCAVCCSNDPRDRRLRTSALITFQGKNILIDAGPDFREQSLREKIPSIDAVLFTHAHSDHIVGIDDLRPYYFKRRQAIPCYGMAATLKQVRSVFFYIFDRDPNYQGGGLADLTLISLEPGVPVEICGLAITPFILMHGNTEVFGYRFGNFAYATDCKAVPSGAREIINRIDHLIVAGLRYEPHPTHMSIDEATQLGSEVFARNTYLIHMSHAVGHQETSAKLAANTFLTFDGMKIVGHA